MKNRKLWLLNPDVIERHERGEHVTDIAKAYGARTQVVVDALRKSGIKVRFAKQDRPWTRDAELLLVRLRAERKKHGEIAHLMGRSYQSVASKWQRLCRARNPERHLSQRRVWYGDEMSMVRSA